MTKAEKVFTDALKMVDSSSIKSWATSANNKPVWIKIANGYVDKNDAATKLSIDIMLTAMG